MDYSSHQPLLLLLFLTAAVLLTPVLGDSHNTVWARYCRRLDFQCGRDEGIVSYTVITILSTLVIRNMK